MSTITRDVQYTSLGSDAYYFGIYDNIFSWLDQGPDSPDGRLIAL